MEAKKIYKLWTVVYLSKDEPLTPFILEATSHDKNVLEEKQKELKEKSIQTVITEEIEDLQENITWIYESPDNGKTIYRRKKGEKERELI